METSDLLKKVKLIELKTLKITQNIFSGEYNSAFKGRGMIFSEVRKYVPGDDVRDIDWNVTAKLSEPYVKVFEEERELSMMLVLDISASGLFGSKSYLKKEKIIEISAILSFSAIKNNDKVGVILFSNEVELYIPPKKGKKHVLRIIRELVKFKPKNKKTNLNEALAFLNKILKKKSIIFLISDFFDDGYEKNIQITSRKHDLIGLQIIDPFEKKMKNIGFSLFFDQENNNYFWLDTSSKTVRKNIEKNYMFFFNYFNNAFLKNGADAITIMTNEDYIIKLLNFFKKR